MNEDKDFVTLDKVASEQKAKVRSFSDSKRPKGGRYMDMVHPNSDMRPPARNYSTGKTVAAPKIGSNAAKSSAPVAAETPKMAPKPSGMKTRKTMDMTRPVGRGSEQPVRPAELKNKVTTGEPKLENEQEKPIGAPMPKFEMGADDEKAPNANNYSLGERSPWLLSDAKVDKRPLGQNVPEGYAGSIRSTKNVYSQRTPTRRDTAEIPGRPMITVTPQKKTGWLWAIATLAIIVVGGGLGLVVYMIFANQ
jgi:hypothetical protein